MEVLRDDALQITVRKIGGVNKAGEKTWGSLGAGLMVLKTSEFDSKIEVDLSRPLMLMGSTA